MKKFKLVYINPLFIIGFIFGAIMLPLIKGFEAVVDYFERYK